MINQGLYYITRDGKGSDVHRVRALRLRKKITWTSGPEPISCKKLVLVSKMGKKKKGSKKKGSKKKKGSGYVIRLV